MQKLIKDGAVVDDHWTVLKNASGPEVLQAVPGKNLIVPMQFWQDFGDELLDYAVGVAIWLDSHEEVKHIGDGLRSLQLIALNFPVFSDGRSYTNARELREQLGFEGELRAIGDVLRDQLFYMACCGFNAFSLRHDQDPEQSLRSLKDFSTNYQATVLEPAPLFRRR